MAPVFKKGDKVVRITTWGLPGTVYAQRLTIQSWGKKTGTATFEKDGAFTKVRIYTADINKHDGFFAPEFYYLEEGLDVEAVALEYGRIRLEKAIQHNEAARRKNINLPRAVYEEAELLGSAAPEFVGFK